MVRIVYAMAAALLVLLWSGGALVLLSVCIDLLHENSRTTLPVPMRLFAPVATLAWLMGGGALVVRILRRRWL